MLANVKASQGLMLAEALTFALADHMPRSEAKKIVHACGKGCPRSRAASR